MNRMVDKKHFRVFVYNENSKRLVNSYDEYKEAIASGLWFDKKIEAESKQKTRKPKDGADS